MTAPAHADFSLRECVLFDSWCSSLENLKRIRSHGWPRLSRLKSNRQINPDGSGNVPVSVRETGADGRRVHLRGYVFIKMSRTVFPDGDAQNWATSDLEMSGSRLEELS